MVNHGVARNEEQPTLNLGRVSEVIEPALKFHEYVVQDVLRDRGIGYPRPDKLAEAMGRRIPRFLHQRAIFRIADFAAALLRTLRSGAFELRSAVSMTCILLPIIVLEIIRASRS